MKLGIMLDCSRNAVINFKAFQKMVDILAKLGYTNIRLYTEDTYEVEGESYFGYLRGRFSIKEIQEMDRYAKSKGIELIPCIQTLGHLANVIKYAEYEKIRDIDDILLVDNEKTYCLIDNMFKSISKAYSTKHIHIGMDETMKIGRGVYLDQHGLENKEIILKKHLNKVLAVANKYGFECEIWGDMFCCSAFGGYGGNYKKEKDNSAEVKKCIPSNLKLCYWDYYSLDKKHYENLIDMHKKLTSNISFAGGVWTWNGFCPASRYGLEVSKVALKTCLKKGVDDVFLTMWGDNGGECSYFAALPSIVAVSEFAKGNFSMSSIKRKFKEIIGMSFESFMLLEKPDMIYQNEQPTPLCPSKTIIYTDPLCGIFDKRIIPNIAFDYYSNVMKILKKGCKNEEYGYLFKFERSLCDLLRYRFELGIKTRKAYKENDKNELRRIIEEDYKIILKKFDLFYQDFKQAWYKEKKTFGFEVQDVRIGGAIQRLKHTKEIINDYLNGKLEKIDELEQEILEPFGTDGDKISLNCYSMLLSTGNI